MSEIKCVKKPWFRKPAPVVSKRMRLVKSANTKLEKTMEALLKSQGIRYQRQPVLLGKPDFRVKNTDILIFCDSTFWHGHRKKEISGEAFKKNKEFWIDKLQNNKKRDAKINRVLKKEGWRVLRFWDTDILRKPEKVIGRLELELKKDG